MSKVLIVGGFWGDQFPEESGVIKKLAKEMNADVYNSGSIDELKRVASVEVPKYDLVFWMADILNSVEDIKVVKKLGSVLIVSKVIRHSAGRIDAVTRIFKFHGNGVIAIHKGEGDFEFELIDALDNTWVRTKNLPELVEGVLSLQKWTNEAKREGTVATTTDLDKFIKLNKLVADKSADQNIRYFGNLSTRCTKMYPSSRAEEGILVSPRNIDKNRIVSNDMVNVYRLNKRLKYYGGRKPSVDTPVQMALYENFPSINFFIHGHTFIEDVPTTEHYYPCGDLREVPEIVKLLEEEDKPYGIINLKNHGFLIYAETLEQVEELVHKMAFKVKEL